MYDKPNFLIVGASRSGTTSLAKYLNAHPDIYIPKQKELRYFVKDVINNTSRWDPLRNDIISKSKLNKNEYFSLMNGRNTKLVGEASIHYLNHPNISIPNIHRHVGDIPIIIMIRNPVHRLISNWKYMLHDLYSLEKTIKMEDIRKQYNYNSFWFYKQQSMYYSKIKAFKESFKSVKILIFEDFFKNVNNNMLDCYNFLNIDPPLESIDYINLPDYDNNNSELKFKNRIFCFKNNSFLNKVENRYVYYFLSHLAVKFISFTNKLGIKINFFQKKQVSENDLEEIFYQFEDDIFKLEKLIDLDLSIWKSNLIKK